MGGGTLFASGVTSSSVTLTKAAKYVLAGNTDSYKVSSFGVVTPGYTLRRTAGSCSVKLSSDGKTLTVNGGYTLMYLAYA